MSIHNRYFAAAALVLYFGITFGACGSQDSQQTDSLKVKNAEVKLDYTVSPEGEITSGSGNVVGTLHLDEKKISLSDGEEISLDDPLIEVGDKGVKIKGFGPTGESHFTAEDGALLLNGDPWGEVQGFDGSDRTRWGLAAALVTFVSVPADAPSPPPEKRNTGTENGDEEPPLPPPPPPPAEPSDE